MARAALLPISSFLLCLDLAGGTDEARQTVGAYKLQNKKGDFSIVVTNWGATLMSVIVPDSKGMVTPLPKKPLPCCQKKKPLPFCGNMQCS
jgi:aldose 1-epimerase